MEIIVCIDVSQCSEGALPLLWCVVGNFRRIVGLRLAVSHHTSTERPIRHLSLNTMLNGCDSSLTQRIHMFLKPLYYDAVIGHRPSVCQ